MRFSFWIMVSVLTSFMAIPAWAQSFNLGLESGMNFSNFVGSDANGLGVNSNPSRLGFVGGGYLSLNFSPNFAIRPELLYEQKGAQVSGTTTNYETDYVEIPILLKFGFGTPGFNPSLLLGPSFDWTTLSNLPANSGAVNSGDVGLVGGIEFDFSQFCLNGRYELGLDNVSENKNLQNGTLTVLMGYSFI